MTNICMIQVFKDIQRQLNATQIADFLPPLAFRVFLFFPFWMAGMNKLTNIEGTAAWFGGSLGLPLPEVMAWLAGVTEAGGALLLLVGFGVRYITLPLMVTMLVAIFAVHWGNGWSSIASGSDPDIAVRLSTVKEILTEHGDYAWLTEKGRFVILQNGIEFGVIYFLMCLSLFFTGAGRYISIDYWIKRKYGH